MRTWLIKRDVLVSEPGDEPVLNRVHFLVSAWSAPRAAVIADRAKLDAERSRGHHAASSEARALAMGISPVPNRL